MKRPFQSLSLLASLSILSTALIQTPARANAPAAAAALPNPILFVTQVPNPADFTTVASTFGNHRGAVDSAPRGGDLWIRYPDGTLRNLTQEAGRGSAGFQGANSIAVRDPSVHWSGKKAVFSMVTGSATQQYQVNTYYWQLYEISGFGIGETVVITPVANQPANFNNASPIYGTDDRIIFTTDRPRDGSRHLYPQLDEYEEAPTVTGLWSLDPASGNLIMLDHVPSGAFTPSVDSFGRVIFTRWDHLQRDQQADSDWASTSGCTACTFNYADESAGAAKLNTNAEVFPEPRSVRTDLLAGTNLNGHTINQFFPWQINEDGTEEETLNHIGRHELQSYFDTSFNNDPNLTYFYPGYITSTGRTNPNSINNFLQIKEDPAHPGVYVGVDAPEFYTHAAGQVISITGAPGRNADQMAVTYLTNRETSSFTATPGISHTGHYRDPLPMTDGTLIASHTAETNQDQNTGNRNNPGSRYDFRLKTLKKVNGYWVPDAPLTAGISKTINYWDPDENVSYSGLLWELNPVEVRARPRPTPAAPHLQPPEQQAFAQAGVTPASLQLYMQQHNLALMVSRNITSRDNADRQQPFNLRVPGGVQSVGTSGKIYDVSRLQLFQADQLRGLGGTADPRDGRRPIAQYLHDPAAMLANFASASPVTGSVAIAPDGSVAAFVPARRAMSWQLTDGAGAGIVRERYWITFQPGEVRLCSSCHGLNDVDQTGRAAPSNTPQALVQLLNQWKSLQTITPRIYLPAALR